jgi:hypothetical protein
MPIVNRAPALAGLRCWARHLLSLPINRKLAVIKAGGISGLPAHTGRDWPDNIDLVPTLALRKDLCIDIARINQMLTG